MEGGSGCDVGSVERGKRACAVTSGGAFAQPAPAFGPHGNRALPVARGKLTRQGLMEVGGGGWRRECELSAGCLYGLRWGGRREGGREGGGGVLCCLILRTLYRARLACSG